MRGTLATSTDVPDVRRSWDLPVFVFAALFVASLVAAISALFDDTFIIGAPLADAVLVPCAAILLGLAAYRTGRPGARPILFAASVVALTILVADLIWPEVGGFPPLGGAIVPAVAAALAGLATVLAPTMTGRRAPGAWMLARTTRHAVVAALLLGLALVNVVAELGSGLGDVARLTPSDVAHYVVSVVSVRVGILAIALVAWWWGAGWLLAVTGLATLIAVGATWVYYPPSTVTVPLALLGAASLAMGLLPPRLRDGDPPPGTFDRPSTRPTVAAVWAILGAFLFIPTLFIGRILASMVDCFSSCPEPSPLAGLAGALDIPLILLFPVLALRLALVPRSSGPADRLLPVVGLAAALFVFVQIVLGQLGTWPFEFMGFTAPATLLIGLGFGAALLPGRFPGTGRLPALAIGCLAFVWVWAAFVFDYGLARPSHFSGLIEAGIVALALAAAFARPEALPQSAATQTTIDSSAAR
jgi:hypothetical protein